MTKPTFQHEQHLWSQGINIVCGVDEVGRGCFAGPIVAAGVIFPTTKLDDIALQLNDSKLLSAKKRQQLSEWIKANALEWQIVEIGLDIINQKGIGFANKQAFNQLIKQFKNQPQFVLTDAFLIEDFDKDQQLPIIHGDQISSSIAAASIIAKVYRDNLMEEFEQVYPGYDFAKNKGYGTLAHRQAIKQLGLSPLHRTSFSLEKFL